MIRTEKAISAFASLADRLDHWRQSGRGLGGGGWRASYWPVPTKRLISIISRIDEANL